MWHSHLKIWPGLFRKMMSRARVSERCWVMCIHLNWNIKMSFSQNFWKNHLLALIRNENHKDYLFKIKLVGLCQVANLMAISNSCLQFQQFSETIREDIDSGYCLHAVLFYSDNISRDNFKKRFWLVNYVCIYFMSLWSQVFEDTFRPDCQKLLDN